jgi:hypothetical protein
MFLLQKGNEIIFDNLMAENVEMLIDFLNFPKPLSFLMKCCKAVLVKSYIFNRDELHIISIRFLIPFQ